MLAHIYVLWVEQVGKLALGVAGDRVDDPGLQVQEDRPRNIVLIIRLQWNTNLSFFFEKQKGLPRLQNDRFTAPTSAGANLSLIIHEVFPLV